MLYEVITSINQSETNFDYVKKDFETKNYPLGKYSATFKVLTIDKETETEISYDKFKGLGGSSNAIFSVVVPGVGNYFVNGGKGSLFGSKISPLLTTFATIGLVGSGIYLKGSTTIFVGKDLILV